MLLLHVLGNAALQAFGLTMLYLDCRRNAAIQNMGFFYVPLSFSALYLIVGLLYWERKRATASRWEARAFGLAGVGVTLFILAADWIQSYV